MLFHIRVFMVRAIPSVHRQADFAQRADPVYIRFRCGTTACLGGSAFHAVIAVMMMLAILFGFTLYFAEAPGLPG